MGQTVTIENIPVPALIIGFDEGKITANSAFLEEFGVAISTIKDLQNALSTEMDLSQKPEKKLFGIGLIKNADTETGVQLSCSALNGNSALLLVQAAKFDIEHLFKNPGFVSIYSGVPLGILIVNATKDHTVFVSDYLTQKLGYSAEEISNKSWNEFTYNEDVQLQDAILNESASEDSKTIFMEKRIASKTGKMYWFSEYTRFFVSNNKNKYKIIVLRDISHEKEIEAELQRAKHLVEDAERLKSAFLDNMPHEIRTPLHAITGFTSLLSDSDLTHEERLEYVKFIQDGSNDILNLMDNIIEIAKLETNQIKAKREKCYVNSIIDKLHNDIVSKQNILEKDELEIITNKANNDPLFQIISDPERIYQIMSHLLNNALKFTDQGSIELGYRIIDTHKIEFFVKDSGVGIDPKEKDIIFKKFGKSGNINTNKNRGSGLGLALSKKLVELLSGEILVESEKDKGSTFKFQIPIETSQKISITKPSVSGDLDWNSKNILIAEDTESNYFFIEAFLEKTKVNLIWAKDGLEAVDIFKKGNIDLVLMDIMMPEMDGYDATTEIKKIDAKIPVIAQTALALPDDEEKCYEAGCDYVLVKPINSEDLIASIKRFIL